MGQGTQFSWFFFPLSGHLNPKDLDYNPLNYSADIGKFMILDQFRCRDDYLTVDWVGKEEIADLNTKYMK